MNLQTSLLIGSVVLAMGTMPAHAVSEGPIAKLESAADPAPTSALAQRFPEHLLTLLHELEVLTRLDAASEGRSAYLAQRIERLILHLRGIETIVSKGDISQSLQRKHHALLRQAERLRDGVGTEARPPTPEVSTQLGATCSSATPVEIGARADGEANASGWLRFQAPVQGRFTVTTLGSEGDTQVEIFQSCGGQSTSTSDDSYGLLAVSGFEIEAGESVWVKIAVTGGRAVAGVISGSSVRGRLTEVDGEPVSNIPVAIYRASPFTYEGGAYTDEQGAYEIAGLDPGIHYVRTELYSETSWLNTAYAGLTCVSPCDLEDATPIIVSADNATEGIDMTMNRGASISGRVTETGSGAPLDEAVVAVFDSTTGAFLRSATTDAAGRYHLQGLADGDIRLSTEHPEMADEMWQDLPCTGRCEPLDGNPLNLVLNQHVRDFDIDLRRLGTLQVDLVNSVTGQPAVSEDLSLYNEAGDPVAFTYQRGRIGGLSTGTYYLKIVSFRHLDIVWEGVSCEYGCDPTTGTPISVIEGEITQLTVELQPNGTISGLVTDASGEVSLSIGDIDVYTEGGTRVGFGVANGGDYRVRFVPPGEYRIEIGSTFPYRPEAWDDRPCPPRPTQCHEAGDLVTVAPGADLSGIDFALNLLGVIEGVVTDSSNGEPLHGAFVRAYDSNGDSRSSSVTSEDGSYRLQGLDAGEHFLTATRSAFDGELYQELPYGDETDPTTGTPVAVALDSVTDDINFTLANQPFVKGRVSRPQGEPVHGSRVQLFDSAGGYERLVTTQADGTYQISYLDAGVYYARASEDDYGFSDLDNELLTVLYDGRVCPPGVGSSCSALDGDPITVTAQGAIVDFELPIGGRISGTVSDGTQPIDDFGRVHIYDDEGLYVGQADVNNGAFLAKGLEAGSYRAYTAFSRGYDNELWDDVPCFSDDGVIPPCDLSLGAAIVVQRDATAGGIDFDLERRGSMTGFVREKGSGENIDSGSVVLYNSTGESVSWQSVGSGGSFTLSNIVAGTYFLRTVNFTNWLDAVYGGDACEPEACDPTAGTPITVVNGGSAGPFIMELDPGPGLSIDIRTEAGQPLSGAVVDLWDSGGGHKGSLIADAEGHIETAWDPGVYLLSTDHGQPLLIDEVWSNVFCPDGPAFLGLCDPLVGSAVLLEEGQPLTEIHFFLGTEMPFFLDGFESGTANAWSSVVGNP